MVTFEIYFDEYSTPVEQSLYFREILVGTGKASHIRVKGDDLPNVCLKLSVSQSGILIEGQPELAFFVNGKKILGSKVIQAGDQVKVGNSSIKVKDFQYENSFAPLNLEKLYDKFHQESEEYDTILSAIERELIVSDDGVTR